MADSKAAIALFIYLATALKDSSQFNGSLVLGFDAQEESGNFSGIREILHHAPKADVCILGYQSFDKDYTGTGYDRGHVVPSADRSRSAQDNSATFLMTNMLPQVPELNREVWREFEEYSRELVAQAKELYIVAGPAGKKELIAGGKVTVPTANWKVVLVLDRPGSGLSGVTSRTQTSAVWMPNDASVNNTDWRRYIVTVDDVESKTGYDFFSNVPVTIQKVIESKRYSP